jgi:hypothetical protein
MPNTVTYGVVGRALGHQVHRTANGIGILIGGKRLLISTMSTRSAGMASSFTLRTPFGRWQVDAVDSHIAQAWLCAANLDVLALALVTLQGHTGQPPHSVGDIRIRQAGDDLVRQHLNDVVAAVLSMLIASTPPCWRSPRTVTTSLCNALCKTASRRRLSRSDRHVRRKWGEAHRVDAELVLAGSHAADRELSLSVRHRRTSLRLQFHTRARQNSTAGIRLTARDPTTTFLRAEWHYPQSAAHQRD